MCRYDSCSNASYLQWYGYVTDAMVFGNLSHKTFVLTGQLTDTALRHVEEASEEEEVKEVKRALIGLLRGDTSVGIRRCLELRHQSEVFEEAAYVLITLAKIAVTSDVAALKELSALPNDIKQLLATAGEKLGKDIAGEALAAVAVGTIDAILAGMPNGGSYLRDMVQMEKDAGLREVDRLLIKVRACCVCLCLWVAAAVFRCREGNMEAASSLPFHWLADLTPSFPSFIPLLLTKKKIQVRMSEKFLLLRARATICKKLQVEDKHERPRLCANCGTFRGLRGTPPFCSPQCQLIKQHDDTKVVPAAGAIISKAA